MSNLATATKAKAARRQVLRLAGATSPRRDSVDRRLVRQARKGTGGIIDHPDDVGGWPTLVAGSPPADTDGDGMPDAWEEGHGLDVDDPVDGPEDADGDGYTNLEEFLNDTKPNVADR